MAGRKQGKYSQTARVLRLASYLGARSRGATLEELAAEFEVTARQARRDLGALEEAGYSIETRQDDDGPLRHVLLRDAGPTPFALGITSCFALLAARDALTTLEGTHLYDDVREAIDKIASVLPKERRDLFDRFQDRFVFLPEAGIKSYAAKDEILDALLDAVLRRLRVQVTYARLGEAPKRFKLEPFTLAMYKQGLYILGRRVGASAAPARARRRKPGEFDPDRVLTFAVERFISVEVLRGETFEAPRSFDPSHLFDGAFGIHGNPDGRPIRVVLDFDAVVRDTIAARRWHPSQRLSSRRGGGVRLEMRVTSLRELLSWVLSWGSHVRVVEPDVLHQEVGMAHEAASPTGRRARRRAAGS